MNDRTCDTCMYKAAESVDGDGERIVDCEINELQMYSPWSDECKHWEKAIDED